MQETTQSDSLGDLAELRKRNRAALHNAHTAAKRRLFEKVARAEELIVGLEQPLVADIFPEWLRVARSYFWPLWLARWDRARLNRAKPEILERLAQEIEGVPPFLEHASPEVVEVVMQRRVEIAEALRDMVRTASEAANEAASDVELVAEAWQSVLSVERATKLAQTVARLKALGGEMRRDGLEMEARVFVCRLSGFTDDDCSPALRPYSSVVDLLDDPDIGSKPTAQRLWKAACGWMAEHHPQLREELRDLAYPRIDRNIPGDVQTRIS